MKDEFHETIYDNSMPGLGGRPLWFLHIPKTAGTSLRDMLCQRFAPEEVMGLPLEDAGRLKQKIATAHGYRFVHGHVPYAAVDYFQKCPFIFTVLRDPVDRAVSSFYFLQEQCALNQDLAAAGRISRERANDALKAGQSTLAEFMRTAPKAARRQLGNLQVEFLTCPDVDKRHRYDGDYDINVSEKELAIAMERLSSLDVFGLRERLPEFATWLAHALQTRPFSGLAHINQTRSRPVTTGIDADTLAALRDLTFFDRKLYVFACELFEHHIAAMARELGAGPVGPSADAVPIGKKPLPASFTAGTPIPGEGWYAPEYDGDRWVNWTGPSRESWIDLGSPSGAEAALRIEVKHVLKQELLHGIELLVNGAKLNPEISHGPAGHTIFAPVPREYLQESKSNRITLRLPGVCCPCELDSRNYDSRALGIAIHRIELVPLARL